MDDCMILSMRRFGFKGRFDCIYDVGRESHDL